MAKKPEKKAAGKLPVPVPLAEPEAKNSAGEEFECAYTVGLTKKGTLTFRTTGEKVGVIELLGLHQLATLKLKGVLDNNQGVGDAMTVEVLRRLQLLTEAMTGSSEDQTKEPGDEKGGE